MKSRMMMYAAYADTTARRGARYGTTPSFVVDRRAYHTWNHSPSKMKNATMQ